MSIRLASCTILQLTLYGHPDAKRLRYSGLTHFRLFPDTFL